MSSRKMTRPSRSPAATQTSEKPASTGAPISGSAGILPAGTGTTFGTRRQDAGAPSAALQVKPVTSAEAALHAVPLRLQTLAGDGFKMRKFDGRQILLFSVPRDGAGQRMRGQFFQRVGELRDFVFASRRKALHIFHAQFAGGERAGFVEADDVDLGQFFHRRAAAKENSMPRAKRNRRQHRLRNGKHQRARRRHDQQRHRAIKRAVRFRFAGRHGKGGQMKIAATTQKTWRAKGRARRRCNRC